MKLENEIDLPSRGDSRTDEHRRKAGEFASATYEQFKALLGLQKGMVIDLREDLPADLKWPSMEEVVKMPIRSQNYFRNPMLRHLKFLFAAYAAKARLNSGSKYTPWYKYVGNGRVALYWKFKTTRVRKTDAQD